MTILVVVHVGLWIVVLVQSVALCVLYFQNDRVQQLANTRGALHQEIGSIAPHFDAIDSKTGDIVNTMSFEGSEIFLLMVTVNCQVCQQILERLAKYRHYESFNLARLVIFCNGSNKGCTHLLNGLAINAATLVKHEDEFNKMVGVRILPAMVHIDDGWRILRFFYPSSAEDVISVVSTGTYRTKG